MRYQKRLKFTWKMNFPLVTSSRVYTIYIDLKERLSSKRQIFIEQSYSISFDDRFTMIFFHPRGIDCVFSSLRISIASCLFLDQRDFLDVSLKIVLRILCVVAFSRGRQTNSNTGPLYLLIKSRWTSVTGAYTTLCCG